MRTTLALGGILAVFSFSVSLAAQETGALLVWETDHILSVPESVLPTEQGFILVSNIDGKPTEKDGEGFISMLGEEGELIHREWCSGLNAPKGMTIAGEVLYVTDIDCIVRISLENGHILGRIPVEGALFLNDLCTLPDGRIACSDMQAGRVHILKEDQIVQSYADTLLQRPNGLASYDGDLLVGCAGYIVRMNAEDGHTFLFMPNTGPVDGLVVPRPGTLVTSDWAGKVQLLQEGMEPVVLMDHSEAGVNAADLGWDERHQRLLVPTFFDQRVRAYSLTF
ncbi:MAG TPA: hypothetical protein P5550_06190 [Bacteroidales bacterium]|nr:hypothetical protein [Bacteroidales bacterium]HRZ76896.1 hypothetical protein [Bacteroidales bacterium]